MIVTAAEAQATVFPGNALVRVEGELAGMTSGPLTLSPAFSPDITDYVLRCATGTNTVQITLTAATGRKINILGATNGSIVIQKNLVENQALVIDWHGPKNPAGTRYWIRCLPHNFPLLNVTKTGKTPTGWYVTSAINGAGGSGAYVMVLDDNGTPVWYRGSTGLSLIDPMAMPDGSIAWMETTGPGFGIDPNGAFQDFNLQTRATTLIGAPTPPTDFHELHPMANGDLMMLSSPLKANVDLSGLGLSAHGTIVDCLLQEVNSAGVAVWQWRASEHIAIAESMHFSVLPVGRQVVNDIFHCNSIDTNPTTGQVLLSVRHTDAVYLIDRTSERIVWKMGGNATTLDGEQRLIVADDPQGAFHAQHDARFQPNSDVSLYDDQSWDSRLAARGVQYHIDTAAGTASLDWSFSSPDGHNSAATGSFRRLDGGADNVIAWGAKPQSLFTEVDNAGHILLTVTFPSGQFAYRVQKVGLNALDHRLLRATAGLPAFVKPVIPKIGFIAPASGPMAGGTLVAVTGVGFTGATAVYFGSVPAQAFTVNSDTSIVALAPAGTGAITVSVAGPGGHSAVSSFNLLTTSTSDSNLEAGTGSWTGSNPNSAVSLSPSYSHTGAYSLQVAALGPEGIAASTGPYAAPAGAAVSVQVWFLSPASGNPVEAFVKFYNSAGAVVGIQAGAPIASIGGQWQLVSATATTPVGADAVAVGIEDLSPSGPLYADDATLAGSLTYSYVP